MWYAPTLRGPRLLVPICGVLVCAAVVGVVLGLYWNADYGNCFASRAGLNNLFTLTPCSASAVDNMAP
jgi:hypothetical protein